MTNTQIKDQIQFAGFNPVFFGYARVTYLFNIMCCVFVLCCVCLRSVSCVPNVARFCLSSFSVLCTLCCQFFWIVHPNSPSVFSQTFIQSRKISILIDKFAYFRLLSCVPNIASFSGLFIVDCSVGFPNFY